MTPRLVRRRYSNGLVLLAVWRNGYKNRGMWAARNAELGKKIVCVLHYSYGRSCRSLRPITKWCRFPTTDRVFTGLLDTLIHLCNVVITGYVQYTFRSLSVFWWINGHCSECVCWLPCLHVRGHTLQQRQCITHPVGLMSRQGSGVNRGVDVHDFLFGNTAR